MALLARSLLAAAAVAALVAVSVVAAAEYLRSADTCRHMDAENGQTRVILTDPGLTGAAPAR